MGILVTGASGLISSSAVFWFDSQGRTVYGVDNNMRRDFFSDEGDTTWMALRSHDAWGAP
jgi:CDP-paratose 2-epimerase